MACEEKCFTFIWKLENVSYCVEGKDEAIYSPEFVVDSINETKWFLGLYPRGEEDGNYIGFFLFRGPDSKGAVPKKMKFEFAFINNNGSVLTSRKAAINDFLESEGHGFPDLAEREEVFNTKRSAFLPQDILTARCRIWKSDGEMAEDVRCFARTRIGVQRISFFWNVKNFSTLESGEKYTYQMKSVAHDKQSISANLSLTEGLGSEKSIRFELIHQDQAIKFSTLQLSLVDASRNRVNCNRDEFWFQDPSKSKELKFCFTKNKLMEMKNSYLPDDILSLHWEWAFSKGVVSNEIENFQYSYTGSDFNASNAQNMNNQKMMPISYSLNDNLKSLYDENFLCDVKLKTSTSIFPAHKIILSASSSVFKAMFSNDMKENGSNCVDIEDLSDDTINRMLLFMYTTRVEDLTWERASHLYAASDKYAILSLKDICSSYLKDNLSPSKACEVLLLSDSHADSDLKCAVQDYILKHGKQINSDEWKLLMETNAKLAAETVCLQFK
ncbi:Speckle-type POZ protein B [Araneus ventricosus]|uniref:Speckle-type POZ protein B n=1 Tax=Araneus ventricosus TaxID=182803 RepID=A0A4Y2D7H8_ARAVE|nr:Speckle-type POZ protein B [Araneus ventricosus]